MWVVSKKACEEGEKNFFVHLSRSLMRGMEGGKDEQRHGNGYLFGFFGV